MPEYVLLLGGSTPTTRIDFTADGDQRWQFGDAAAACVVSVKHRGKFAVVEAESRFHGEGGDTFLVDQFLPLSARVEELTQRIEELTADAAARAIFKHKLHGPRVALACGEASAGMAQRIAKIHSISRTSSTFEDNGYTLSSGCFLGFEKLRSTLKLGDQLLLAQAHPGFMSGYTLCEVM